MVDIYPLLNIVGIALVAYGLYYLSRNKEDFNPEEFISEVNNFSRVLEEKEEEARLKPNNIPEKTMEPKKEVKESKKEGYSSSLVIDRKDLEPDKNLENKKVLSLRAAGLSKEEIAKETKKSIREVEVILKLNNL